MKTRLLRRASAGALALTLITATAALADNLIVDGDYTTTVDSGDALALGNICAGDSKTGSALMAINRVGGGQTFANGASVTVAVDQEGDNTTTTMDDSSITLPSNWTGQTNNTLSTDTAKASVTVDSTNLSVSSTAYSQSVKFSASGLQAGGGTLDRPGNLMVTFKVIDCAPTNAAPNAAFSYSPTTPEEGSPVNFTDQSSDPDGNATIGSWAWTFGDGTGTVTTQNPTHTFADNGAYSVCLTVTDDQGATDQQCKTVEVANVAPSIDAATFGPNKLKCGTDNAGLTVTFSDPGSRDTHVINVDWDSDGIIDYTGSAVADQPVSLAHTYGPGVHSATITVTDNYGDSSDPVQAGVEVLQTYATTFLAPFDGSSPSRLVTNTMKNGRVVPVKVKLYDECALSYVTDPTELVTIKVSSAMGQTAAVSDAIETFADAGQSSAGTNQFRWSADGFWIYNLDSKGLSLTTNNTYRVDAYVDGVQATTETWALLKPVK